jgi:bifunctional non-homologous end joining protein LigD
MKRELYEYRKKRSAGRTPEPFGDDGEERPGLFVVQLHAARGRHYDLRLEIGGVLVSFAVPKGPSLDPEDKRLAVATEDHPIEYGDFEGVIPPDNYGAGSMIVWDRGRAIHHLDPEEGLELGKLLFVLEGYKLRGLFTLVKTKKNPKEWLLIKKPDAWARAGGNVEGDLPPESVLSGLTVDELAQAGERSAEIAGEIRTAGARPGSLLVQGVDLMLAETAPAPFSRSGWLFELKIDGFRLLAGRSPKAGGPGELELRFRGGGAATRTFPEITRALRALTAAHFVLDGEVTVLDEAGKPSFQRLQKRAHGGRKGDAERAALELPATFFVFDLLAYEGLDLRPLPLATRKAFLARLVPPRGAVRFADHVEEQGAAFFQAVERLGLEGVMAKRGSSPYQAGRGPNWLKVRAQKTADLAIVGFLRPKDKQKGLESLHLAWWDGARWRYAGRAGSGLTAKDRADLAAELEPHRRPAPGFGEAPKATARDVWVEPREVVEVRYLEVTEAGQLRHPVILRRRSDKRAQECTELPGATAPAEAPEPEPPAPPGPVKKVVLSRREKVFWPEDGFTKGDLVDYYQAIAPALLPYLRDRPLVLDRFPDGIGGKSFFQKNAPEGAPDWVRIEGVRSDDAGSETTYFVCDDVETLLYVVNLGAIPLHVWSSRFPELGRPDWAILDLDAKGLPYSQALEVAREVGRLCTAIEQPAYLKTSGASGLHVLLPTGRRLTHEQARQLAELLARLVAARRPEIASIARSPSAREGKVYVDFLQNGYGKLLVAPFSVRPRPGAPVSTPLHWQEVDRDFRPEIFNLRSVPERVEKQKSDPWAGLFDEVPDLGKVLARLVAELGA